MAAALKFDRVTVAFDGFTVLDELDFTLNEGELRFLIGPNGAGKTTILDVITGKTRPIAGEVWFHGVALTRVSEHTIVRQGIGRKFQTPAIFSSLTVQENVEVAADGRKSLRSLMRARPRDLASAAERAREMLERVGLQDRASVRAGSLAHGEKQWLEIAMLLAQDPKLLLLDEPVAGMTRQERERTGLLLESLAADHTIVVVEHDMEFVRQFARTVTALHQGRILCEGTIADVQNDPRVREVYLGRGHARVA